MEKMTKKDYNGLTETQKNNKNHQKMEKLKLEAAPAYEQIGIEISQKVTEKVCKVDENGKPLLTDKGNEKREVLKVNGLPVMKETYNKTFIVEYDKSLNLSKIEQVQELSFIFAKALKKLKGFNEKFAKLGIKNGFSKNKITTLKVGTKYEGVLETTKITLKPSQIKKILEASDNDVSMLLNTMFIGDRYIIR